jgi:hypothetical protein
VVRAADLLVRGGRTVTAGNAVPSAGELAVFCRPVVTAPAVAQRDGRVLAGGWLPDFVRLGGLERHLGDGVIEAISDAAIAKGRLRRPERRRLMSYPLVIWLMVAMTLMPGRTASRWPAWPAWRGCWRTSRSPWNGTFRRRRWSRTGGCWCRRSVFWEAAGPLVSDGEPSAVLRAGMAVCAADGDAGEPRGHAGEPGDVRDCPGRRLRMSRSYREDGRAARSATTMRPRQ